MSVLLALAAFVLGTVVLITAADVFVVAAEGVAVHRRWSPAVIGAVVIGFGTSLPEFVTSVVAAFAGEPDLAIGNAAGSNVANLLLVLGLAAVVAPIAAPGRGPGRDIGIAAVGGLLLAVLASNGRLGLLDGVLLGGVLLTAIVWQVVAGRGHVPGSEVPTTRPGVLAVRVLGGLLGVVVGAQLLVYGASSIALEFGVPTILIGSVLVAIGTSLPELATAVASARRGQTELLIGNLIGSNAFNALGVVGASALVGAGRGDVLTVDTAAMAVVVAAAAVTVTVGVWLWRRPRVGRLGGALLLGAYVVAVPSLLAVS